MANISFRPYRTALTLLRIPFSIYLMPFYWLALSNIEFRDTDLALQVFLILHLLVYPSSNGLNSYYDKDTDSIGGLEKPPLPNSELLILSCVFIAISTIWALLIGPVFGTMVFIYHLVSTAYSHPVVRLKASPFWSTASVAIFQGGFTYAMVLLGLGADWDELNKPWNWAFITACSVLLIGSYPLTQIYQHRSDAERGDLTISRILGIRGTFNLALIMFPLGTLIMFLAYAFSLRLYAIPVFLIAGIPSAIFLQKWKRACETDPSKADFKNTMQMNKLSSLCLSAGFIVILLMRAGIL